jgi:hypothetical protein
MRTPISKLPTDMRWATAGSQQRTRSLPFRNGLRVREVRSHEVPVALFGPEKGGSHFHVAPDLVEART